MLLSLKLVKSPPGLTPLEVSKSFDGSAGLIGRGAENNWVLKDPERFLSSKHCQIVLDNDHFFLLDTSTNGTFFKGSVEPLGRGNKVLLSEGDTFEVGEYRFKVESIKASELPSAPFGSEEKASAPSSESAVPVSPFDTPTPESVYMSSDYQGEAADILPDEMKVVDPLVALGIADGPASSSSGARSRDEPARAPAEDMPSSVANDPMTHAPDWPDAHEQSVIPDDWDEDISILRGRPGEQMPEARDSQYPFQLSEEDSLIVNKPGPSVPAQDKPFPVDGEAIAAQRPTPVEPVPQPQGNRPIPGRRPPPVQEVAHSTTVSPSAGASSAASALISAMGLNDAMLSDAQAEEIGQTVGLLMRTTVEGLMLVLRSRTCIKNEFRINVTTIQPIENNPLKFSANVDDALDNMFLRNTRAYKKPLESVQESFDTIADHQLAVIAGIRSAFRSVLKSFDPLVLEEEFKKNGKGGMLGGVLKGKFWQAYQEYYQHLVSDLEGSFQDLFGDEFVQAYEEQLRKLAQARHNNH